MATRQMSTNDRPASVFIRDPTMLAALSQRNWTALALRIVKQN